MAKAPTVDQLRAMGVSWAEEHWKFDRTYGRFVFDWAYASLADCEYGNDDNRRIAASLICDWAIIRFNELKSMEQQVP